MTNTISENIYAGYNTSIQALSCLNPESVAAAAATVVTTVATTAIDGLSAIYFYPPNILPAEVEFLDIPLRALVMVPVIVGFVIPVMFGLAQLTYEGTKLVVDKLGREACPESYSKFQNFMQLISA